MAGERSVWWERGLSASVPSDPVIDVVTRFSDATALAAAAAAIISADGIATSDPGGMLTVGSLRGLGALSTML